MQLQLGSFRFESPVESSQHEVIRVRRWVQRQRLGRPPTLEDHGRSAVQITLRGAIPITTADSLNALDALRTEAGLVDTDTDPQPLTLFQSDADGVQALGAWVVEQLIERRRGLRTATGIPSVVEFDITLIEAAT